MTQNYNERFQERVDELLFLENKVTEHIQGLIKIYRHAQENYEEITSKVTEKITRVDESLKKINEASEKIADYMTHCDQHAKYTRNIFISALLGSVVVIAATLWWSNNLKSNLASDIKAFKDLEYILKNEPILKHVDGKDYVRLAETKTTDLYDENGDILDGDYAEVWHKK